MTPRGEAALRLFHIRRFHIADDGLPTVVHMDVLNADNCCPPLRRRRSTSTCIANAFIKRAAADASAAIRRSVPKAASSLARTAMEAECVQAISTASAPSISIAIGVLIVVLVWAVADQFPRGKL